MLLGVWDYLWLNMIRWLICTYICNENPLFENPKKVHYVAIVTCVPILVLSL